MWRESHEFSFGAEALGDFETSQGKVKTLRCQEVLILWLEQSRTEAFGEWDGLSRRDSQKLEEENRDGVDSVKKMGGYLLPTW